MSQDTAPDTDFEPWPRWPYVQAWILACAVFPLIWIGGLVTTYEAGMSVEDWPTTYGHWFYPLQKWAYAVFANGWDMFLEHGHRMWAQLVGVLAILAAAAIGARDFRRNMWWMAAALLAGVAIQATLGGMRVIWDARVLAKIHGCTAAAYFALCAANVSLCSRSWRTAVAGDCPLARQFQRLAAAVVVLLYLGIVLGAQLRHALPDEAPVWFSVWLWSKLIVAALAAAGVFALGAMARRVNNAWLLRRSRLLMILVVVQLTLGAATWVVNYGVPAWFRNYVWSVEYTVVAEGAWQVTLTTAHVAVGSLSLVAALSLAMWSWRLLSAPAGIPSARARAAK